jgi:spoIIIJ-associated protein
VSDRVFTGGDVEEALALAGAALGVGVERLRYVVLDRGTPGGLGLKPTPARVAVLLGSGRAPQPPGPPTSAASLPSRDLEPERRPAGSQDAGAQIQELAAALARAAGADVAADVTQDAESVEIRFRGPDAAAFLLEASEPPVIDALEHILHGMFAHRVAPLRLRVECEGWREFREQKLRAQAQTLAAAVLQDGAPRTTDPLNSYERRLVHVAVADIAGVISYSVGGGADRRVTIAPEKASLGGEVH